jgi:hypothetical protein
MWKKLTATSGGTKIMHVNLDNVCYLERGPDYTTVYFTATDAQGKLCSIRVKEPPDSITAPLESATAMTAAPVAP